jgi:hypothetical protein
MVMGNRSAGRTRLSKRRALRAIASAFKWLADNKSCDYRVQWLDEYPLLLTSSPSDAFLNYRLLSSHTGEVYPKSVTFGPFNYPLLASTEESIDQVLAKGRYVVFTYLDTPIHSHDLRKRILLRQEETIRSLFKESYNSECPLIVRGDTIQSNGCNSIKECITNLLCAKFFMSNGYMVLEDTGSGPDLIAFKTSLLEELRERRFVGRGASVSQLATIRAFGKVTDVYQENCPNEEVIAVESESVNPQSGIKQLRGEFSSQKYSYMGFFDRRVLAAPFFCSQPKGLDMLTYDDNGIQYCACANVPVASDFWKSKKELFVKELHDSLKAALLLNLTYEEIEKMISTKPLTFYEVIQRIPNLEMMRILDKIESVL